jgi:hypothetical protein
VKLILRAVTKIGIQYPLVAWNQDVFFQDVEELTKIRSSLHDDSVDMLNFLRGYFKTENN